MNKNLLIILAAACSPVLGSAQIDISVNNQAFQQGTPADPTADPLKALEEQYLTGDGDLLLLKERDFFQVRSVSDLVHSSNARLSNDDKHSDTFLRQEFALRASTQVDRKWDVYAEGGVIFTRFFDENDLNTNVPFVRVGASTSLDGGVVGGSVTHNWIQDDEFEQELIRQLVLTGFYLKPYQLNADWLAVPRIVTSYTFADPDDFSYLNLTLGVDLIHPIREDLAWISGLDIYGNWYKDYFEETTGESREDFGLRTRTELRWTICPNAVLRGVLGFNHQDSSIGFLDYEEITTAVSLLLTAEF